MAASKYDFAIEQGTSFKLSLIYKDANGTPVNLTGWCARLVWKTNTNNLQIFSSDNLDLLIWFRLQQLVLLCQVKRSIIREGKEVLENRRR